MSLPLFGRLVGPSMVSRYYVCISLVCRSRLPRSAMPGSVPIVPLRQEVVD